MVSNLGQLKMVCQVDWVKTEPQGRKTGELLLTVNVLITHTFLFIFAGLHRTELLGEKPTAASAKCWH